MDYCSAEGYMRCQFSGLASTLPPECAAVCPLVGTYVYVWQAESCANGCNGPGPDGGIGGNGGSPGCR
jgi:hypothetical protein